ncbi:MAG TPA: hypothetical protein VI932_01200 [Bacteroidota bacterium]|nr:hypothetical protein [Bacteroidota bacterium]
MKNISGLIVYGFAAILVPLAGCLEINVKTIISTDGSSERVVSVKRPSQSLPEHAYPLPSDTSWTTEWKETGDKDLPYEYTARKKFATPEALAAEYARQPDTGAVRLTFSLEKSFEWFFTYFDYRETYTLRNPFRRIPASEYFTTEEIGRIGRGEKTDSLNKKIEEWDFRNMFEELYGRLIDAVGTGDPAVNRSSLEKVKEEMYRFVREDTSKNEKDDVRNTLRLLRRALHTDVIFRYEHDVARVLAEVDSMLESRNAPTRWVSSVVMSGLLIGTNGEVVEGNAITWTFEAKQLLVGEYPMEARSRVVNVWAFIVTGFAGLLILLPAILRLLRRRA